MNRVLGLLLTLVTAVFGPAAPAHAGSYGTELPFASGVGGRASAIGLATTSITGTPSLHVSNPALLAGAEGQGIEFFRTTLFDSDAQFLAASYVYPTLDRGTLGVSILRIGIGNIEHRDGMNNLLSSDLSDNLTRAVVGYSARIAPPLHAGINVKLDRHTFGDASGTGIGVDAGLLAEREFGDGGMLRRARVGLAMENLIEPAVKLDQEDVPDPMRTTAGVSVDVEYGPFALTSALDVVSPRYSPMRVRLGQEIGYGPYFTLRTGFDGSTPTVGIGGRYRTVTLDYAYRSEDLGSNHRVSLAIGLGTSREERRARRDEQLAADLEARVDRAVGELESGQLRSLRARADSLFAAGDFQAAQDRYDMVLLWSPGDEPAQRQREQCERHLRIARARELMAAEAYLDALYQLNQARQIAPDDDEIAGLAAACQEKIDTVDDQTRMVERLLATSIDLYAQARLQEAMDGFEEVLRFDPDNAIAREYRNKSHAGIESAVQQHVMRSRELARREKFDDAIDQLQRALAYRPESQPIRSEIAALHAARDAAQARRSEEAAATAAGTVSPPRDALRNIDTAALDSDFERGVGLLEHGRFEDAAAALRRVWSVAPGHRDVVEPLTKAYLFMGMKMYSEGRYTDAITMWEQILAINPDNVKARRYLEKSREEASRLNGVSP